MKRRQAFGSIAAASSAVFVSSHPTFAQSDDLETRVAELEVQMAVVLERLRVLESGDDHESVESTDQVDRGFALEGQGLTVSENFNLNASRFEVTATCSLPAGVSDNFAIWIYGPDDLKDLLFNEIVKGSFEGTVLFTADKAGEYFLEIDTEGTWTIIFRER